mgnify:CR=1 FL=1
MRLSSYWSQITTNRKARKIKLITRTRGCCGFELVVSQISVVYIPESIESVVNTGVTLLYLRDQSPLDQTLPHSMVCDNMAALSAEGEKASASLVPQ